jgi:cell division protease FtsH
MDEKRKWNTWYFVGAFILLMFFESIWTTWRGVESLPYSEFEKLLNEGRIVEVTVDQEKIRGRLKEPSPILHHESRRTSPCRAAHEVRS